MSTAQGDRGTDIHFCSTCRSLPASIFVFIQRADGSRALLASTDELGRYTGYRIEELIADTSLLWSCIAREDWTAVDAAGRRAVTELVETQVECRMRPHDSEDEVWVNVALRPKAQPDGSVLCYGLIVDSGDRKGLENTLRHQELRFANTVASMSGAVFRYVAREKGKDSIEYLSPGCEGIFEVPEEAVADDTTRLWQMIESEDIDAFNASVKRSAQDLSPFQQRYRIRSATGKLKWLDAMGQPQRTDDGNIAWDTVVIDVTERVTAEQRGLELEHRLRYVAVHDSLTGLPNRVRLEQRLKIAIERMASHGSGPFAVVNLDLDRFKVINDSLGQDGGDDLLRHVARILDSSLRSTDIACRIAGDEFAILLEEVGTKEEVRHAITRINERLTEPLRIGGQSIRTSVSMGVVVANGTYRVPGDVLRDANIAMHRAKGDKRSFYALFDTAMHAQARERLQLEADLRTAVEEQQLLVYYQPIVCTRTHQTLALEALVRWLHPQRGLTSPTAFIPVAEETGQIRDIDRLVIRQAIADLQELRETLGDAAPEYVSVNCSARDLASSDCVAFLDELLACSELDQSNVQLEVTESMLIEEFDQARATLQALSKRGFRISLDDFGTGYSSLSYLHQLPVDTLKADRSFIQTAESDSTALGILSSLAVLAKSLHLPIIAEGVETEKQLKLVTQLGYHCAQGYHYSRPLPAKELRQWLIGKQERVVQS